MINLLLSVVFSAALPLIFRLFVRFGVRPFQAIAVNYLTCVAVGTIFLPQTFSVKPSGALFLTLFLGVCFLVSFNLTSLSVRRAGVTVTTLATNLSLVLPVSFSLLVLGRAGQSLTTANYAGLVLALVAIGLSSVKGRQQGDEARLRGTATGATGAGFVALLPLAVFVMNGLINILTNALTRRAIFPETVFTWLAFSGAAGAGSFALVMQLARGRERLHGHSVAGGVVLGVSNYLSYLFLVKALGDFGGNGAVLFPVYNLSVMLVAAGVAVAGFRERLSRLNWLGMGLAVGALGLLISA